MGSGGACFTLLHHQPATSWRVTSFSESPHLHEDDEDDSDEDDDGLHSHMILWGVSHLRLVTTL